ncbi:hypothetical protein AI2679V1_2067 [Enterobacter cloacae]|nr:hypothetical protein AI2679V1_2067 [Enterobacter cloacae]CAH3664217.1 hypothetical protein AI2679V1_2067 [Enterobacter cloacae]
MHDHVDFVVGQWSRAMPELDASSMKIFGRMLRLMKHLGKERAQAMAQFGFREGEFDVLASCVAPVSRTAFPPRSSINRC